MTNAKPQHPNAALTPRQRRKMVLLVIDDGWTIEATAERFQIDAKTVTKWRNRYLYEGDDGLFDRSSRAEDLGERNTSGVPPPDHRATQTTPLGRRPHRPRSRPGRLNRPNHSDR